MQQTIVVRKARTPVAYTVVAEVNGTRLLRPTALPVVALVPMPKPAHAALKQCEIPHAPHPKPRRPARELDPSTFVGANRGRGNRIQMNELCAAIVRRQYYV
jgi:hypothetical protein